MQKYHCMKLQKCMHGKPAVQACSLGCNFREGNVAIATLLLGMVVGAACTLTLWAQLRAVAKTMHAWEASGAGMQP